MVWLAGDRCVHEPFSIDPVQEVADACLDVVSDLPHRVQRLPDRVRDVPVEVFAAGIDRAGVAAPHRDHVVRRADGLVGERFRELGPERGADLVEDGIRRSVADAGLELSQISGVCIGLPGVVERGAGICRASPLFGERDIPLAAELTRRLDGVAATLDSDVNLVTLAEHWFGQARGLDDFLVVSVEMGLGLGIMHKGELFRGANGLGPDLGDLLVKPPNGAGLVRLAEVASEESMLADARRALAASEHEQAFRLGRGMEKLLERAEAGDAAIVALLRAAGEALGFAIANLIVLFAPPKVILAGAALAAGEALVRPLRDTVSALLPPSLADVADIVVHEWGDEDWARGAAAMTLRDLYGAPWGTTGPAPHL